MYIYISRKKAFVKHLKTKGKKDWKLIGRTLRLTHSSRPIIFFNASLRLARGDMSCMTLASRDALQLLTKLLPDSVRSEAKSTFQLRKASSPVVFVLFCFFIMKKSSVLIKLLLWQRLYQQPASHLPPLSLPFGVFKGS